MICECKVIVVKYYLPKQNKDDKGDLKSKLRRYLFFYLILNRILMLNNVKY